ncbi:MAG TPA: lytic transglycosylase domain-containing protein [Candidatus Binataceae bacterium]|nr:lytic transglycosylase domain-containing protein [Candidatus Binataceae bacterium]
MNPLHPPLVRSLARAGGIGLAAMLIILLIPIRTISDSENRLHYSKQEIRRAVAFYARRYRLDPALLRAVIKAESDFRQHVVSKKGAVGLMQLTPDTAATLRVANIYDSVENIRGGARQLRRLLNLYQGNLPLALAAYNAGVNRVKGRRVPQIRETRLYVRKVLRYYQQLHPTLGSLPQQSLKSLSARNGSADERISPAALRH